MPIRVAYLENMFSDVDILDARAALDMWAAELGESMGNRYSPKAIVLENHEALRESIMEGTIELVTLHAIDYLRYYQDFPLEPALVPIKSDSIFDEFCLIVRKEGGANGLPGIRAKEIIIHIGGNGDIAHVWLDSLLLKTSGDDSRSFFKSVKSVEKVSQALLPVFFGQTGGCVVSKNAFETMAELNPQLGRDLVALEKSSKYPIFIACFRASLDPEDKSRIVDSSCDLHNSPQGRQILTLFHSAQVVPFETAYLKELSILLEEYERLKALHSKDSANKDRSR